MSEIVRMDVNEEWAHAGIVKAGDFCFLSYCTGNVGGSAEEQINGAFDEMERRLSLVGLTLADVVQMDCLFRDIWNIPVMERVIKKRFSGSYPARKSLQTEFAHIGGEAGLQFQVDAVAYCPKNKAGTGSVSPDETERKAGPGNAPGWEDYEREV